MFKKRKPFKVALDVDDVLFPCIEKALNECQEKYNFNPPLVFEDVNGWLPLGNQYDVMLDCFKDLNFFDTQKPYPGAQEFVKELVQIADVYILTAVPVLAMGVRASKLLKYFPEIPADHIIMTSSKDVVEMDLILDDGSHNILSTRAKHPVIMRRPWNKDLTGILSVNNYEEFLTLVKEIKNNYEPPKIKKENRSIIALVGVSGSGKKTITEELIKTGKFQRPHSFTDKLNAGNNYIYLSKEEFAKQKEKGLFIESTTYAGYQYGSSKKEIEDILNSGKNVIMPIDMCGAIGLKSEFSNDNVNVITVFVNRKKKDILYSILRKNCSYDEQVMRILSIDAERKNADICDFVINNDGNLKNIINDLLSIIE